VNRYFYGNIKWFEPTEQPEDIRSLPAEFARAKALWDVDAEGNHNDIVDLLNTYIAATFIPQNVDQASGLFADAESEVGALAVRIGGVDFSKGPIPMVKAEAVFEVAVVSDFDSADLESRNLHDALSFRWEVARDADTAELDFSHGDHQGAECVPVNEPPFLTGRGEAESGTRPADGDLGGSDENEGHIGLGPARPTAGHVMRYKASLRAGPGKAYRVRWLSKAPFESFKPLVDDINFYDDAKEEDVLVPLIAGDLDFRSEPAGKNVYDVFFVGTIEFALTAQQMKVLERRDFSIDYLMEFVSADGLARGA
jgi:hypothetical protein